MLHLAAKVVDRRPATTTKTAAKILLPMSPPLFLRFLGGR